MNPNHDEIARITKEAHNPDAAWAPSEWQDMLLTLLAALDEKDRKLQVEISRLKESISLAGELIVTDNNRFEETLKKKDAEIAWLREQIYDAEHAEDGGDYTLFNIELTRKLKAGEKPWLDGDGE